MFNFLRASPCVDEIEDSALVGKKYKYWRLRIFLGMYLGYAFYYFTRKSFYVCDAGSSIGTRIGEVGVRPSRKHF